MISGPRYRLPALLLLVLCAPLPACAQQETLPALASVEVLPDAPSALLQQQATAPAQTLPDKQETEAERKARLHAQAGREVKAEEQQRIAIVVPNFNTVITGRAVPLSKGQKTDLAVHATLDPFNFVSAFLFAGLSELTGSHRGFGWGPEGYAKRVGANIADVVDSTMLAGAVYPILLRQDPRFFRQGTGTKRARVRHALLGAVICRGDNGRRQPNYSNVLGNFTAGLISNAYYPSDETGIGLSLVNSTIVTGEGALGNLALEFSPDVEKYLHRKKLPPPQPSLPEP